MEARPAGQRRLTASPPTQIGPASIDVTDKLNIVDQFSYNNWRIPSMWATADTNLFATLPQAPGQTGFLLPVAMVTPANFAGICSTAPYNGPNCPQHNSSSWRRCDE